MKIDAKHLRQIVRQELNEANASPKAKRHVARSKPVARNKEASTSSEAIQRVESAASDLMKFGPTLVKEVTALMDRADAVLDDGAHAAESDKPRYFKLADLVEDLEEVRFSLQNVPAEMERLDTVTRRFEAAKRLVEAFEARRK